MEKKTFWVFWAFHCLIGRFADWQWILRIPFTRILFVRIILSIYKLRLFPSRVYRVAQVTIRAGEVDIWAGVLTFITFNILYFCQLQIKKINLGKATVISAKFILKGASKCRLLATF